MRQDNPRINEYVAGGASNVLWTWEREQIDGEQAMRALQRLFSDYREEFHL